MKTRLRKLMTSEGLTAAKLAEIAGVQPSTVSHILSGRNYPSFDFITNLLKAYPLLNSRWLLLGEGDIYMHDQNQSTISPQQSNHKKNIEQALSTVNDLFITNSQGNDQQNVSIDDRSDSITKQEVTIHDEVAEKIVIFYTNGTFSMYRNK